jgi:cytochrome bd-type quinol oxidase subunit 1
MSLDSQARTGTIPGQRTASGHASLLSPTGEHIGLTPVAEALRSAPVRRNPAPPAKRLFGLCVAAAGLGGIGLLIGVRGWFALVTHKAETWYLPAMLILGVFGVLTAAGSFLTVHHRRAPWICLGVSAATLIASIIVTGSGVR